uniref:Putative biotinidase n=1 Tax=Panstrongylus lignarius TaxID=156445 RepID=A0A224XDX6_9HEMI
MASGTVIFLAIFLHLFTNTLQSVPADDYYVAAVVEYSGVRNLNLSSMENAQNNVKRYVSIMKKVADNKVDIIVFPEIGLFSFDNTIFVEVPDPKDNITPATNESTHEVLKSLSQAAIDNKLYVVVNLHELYKNGTKEYKYNTNVVFDRNGTVIARYRKYNLFGERNLNRPETPEYVMFNTDFGVTFGTFTCFDIVFEEPAMGLVTKYNITDIVFPTAWFSELPLYIAIQEQSAWAYATDVNLLASGYNNMSTGNTGSGIYAGTKGPITYIESESTGTKILIGKVPKVTAKGRTASLEPATTILFDEIETKSAPILHEDLKIYTTKLIEPENFKPTKSEQFNISGGTDLKGLERDYNIDEKLCHGDFCCNFNLSFSVKYYQEKYNFKDDSTYNKTDAFYHFKYRLIALDGIRQYIVGNSSGQQVCAITPCLNDDLNSCAISNNGKNTLPHQIDDKDLGNLTRYSTEFQSINITGNFHNKRVLYLPSVLLSSDDINTFGNLIESEQLKLNVENNTESARVSLLLKPKRFASGGIYARLFERDNKPSAANGFTTNMIISCIVPLIIILCTMIRMK